MPLEVIINGRKLRRGDMIKLNENAPAICRAPKGQEVYIHIIKNNLVGLYSPEKRMSHWGDLDGEVGDGKGWWIERDNLARCIDSGDVEHLISKEFTHRGTDLKDKPCKILAGLDDGLVFVEFEEHVSGCSADGLGKAGHCVAVPRGILIIKRRVKHAK